MSKKGIVDDGLALESAKTRLEFYFDEFNEAQTLSLRLFIAAVLSFVVSPARKKPARQPIKGINEIVHPSQKGLLKGNG